MNTNTTSLKNVIGLPLLLVTIMILVKLLEFQWGTRFLDGSIYPQRLSHLSGIITSPFIHGDWEHLFNNIVSLVPLVSILLFSYKETAKPVIIGAFVITGLLVWIGARPSNHIGMSGVIYALASYLFFAGLLQKDPKAMSISMLIVILHGSMIWGIFPHYKDITKDTVSWESHLFGALTGIALAFHYKVTPPPRKKYSWEIEEEILQALDQIPIVYDEVLPQTAEEILGLSSEQATIETKKSPINYIIKKQGHKPSSLS